ncbi:uncharacterized protein BDR25DRAFT_292694 [Lindgomyces ingoldianus]|uniref:Uncharacterized protein n=1 Tax=Lindgomyces ingoldianus TaxID=673940 RepID=A0ACB6QK72_9PLEO|nr:uncharacterized protein BDR25DRAFT_292694 [Lindgomyces ingoldianus]KAF2466973.1 hypothetical protein BDR25DRAFT_292694 [Lindgomyces ingoldianus]
MNPAYQGYQPYGHNYQPDEREYQPYGHVPPEKTSFLPAQAPISPSRKRRFWHALGRFHLFTLLLSSVALLATLSFLAFLWRTSLDVVAGKGGPRMWHKLINRGWIIRAVTLSSVVIRTSVAAQVGLVTPMIASLLLERAGSRLGGLPMLSIMRSVNNSPHHLIWPAMYQILGSTSFAYISLLFVALVASIVLQFTSTILLLDFADQSILSGLNSTNVAFGLNYNDSLRVGATDAYQGINYWKSRPLSYPRFAEWHHPPNPEDGVADTGPTYRAYLPFSSANERRKLRNFTGVATVLDLRTVCVKPQLSLKTGWLMTDDLLALNGTAGWKGSYSMLSPPKYGDNIETSFNCTIPLESSTGPTNGYWKTSICHLRDLADLKGSIQEDREWFAKTYMVFNTTGSGTDWEASGKFSQWKTNSGEAWTTLTAPNNPSSISATLCFTNPLPFNYEVNMWSKADTSEPSLNWDNTTGHYITHDILHLYDGLSHPSNPEERGILNLDAHANWTAHLAELKTNTKTLNFIWTALDEGFVQGNTDIPTPNKGALLTPWSDGISQAIHRAHIAVFQDIIRTTHNPALAVQALFTILTQSAYYDFLAQFDVSAPATFAFSRQVTIPHEWKGFGIVCAVLGVHFVVFVVVTVLFLVGTEVSMLGNAWQAVCQVVELVEKDVLDGVKGKGDEEVEEVLKGSGRADRIFRVR